MKMTNFAVFSEQGTAASHLMAARFLDAIAGMPGMAGQDADATGAYTQTELGPDCPPTWIEIPRNRWPKSWWIDKDKGIPKYEKPVVRLIRNLHGHPLAGLYWFEYCDAAIRRCGFRPIKGWECLYLHPTLGIILSVYVDDFKVAGIKENVPKVWQMLTDPKLVNLLHLDPPQDLVDNVLSRRKANDVKYQNHSLKKRTSCARYCSKEKKTFQT